MTLKKLMDVEAYGKALEQREKVDTAAHDHNIFLPECRKEIEKCGGLLTLHKSKATRYWEWEIVCGQARIMGLDVSLRRLDAANSAAGWAVRHMRLDEGGR